MFTHTYSLPRISSCLQILHFLIISFSHHVCSSSSNHPSFQANLHFSLFNNRYKHHYSVTTAFSFLQILYIWSLSPCVIVSLSPSALPSPQLAQQMEWAKFHREKWTEATSFAWKNFTNTDVRRMFSFLTVLGKVALPKEKMQEVWKITTTTII